MAYGSSTFINHFCSPHPIRRTHLRGQGAGSGFLRLWHQRRLSTLAAVTRGRGTLGGLPWEIMWGWGQHGGWPLFSTGLNYVYIIYTKWLETWGEHPKNALFMQKMMISTVLFIHFWSWHQSRNAYWNICSTFFPLTTKIDCRRVETWDT